MAICNLSELSSYLKKGTCLLGLDPGSTVIGVAISDPGLRVASPLTSIARKKFADDAAALMTLIRERQVGGLVVGLPKNMDGSEGPSAQSARALVRNLYEKGNLDPTLPTIFWDERLSSAAVERFMIEGDMSRKRRDAVIDKAAAAYILQGALDALARK
jgi:putative Holliday junction resolvase